MIARRFLIYAGILGALTGCGRKEPNQRAIQPVDGDYFAEIPMDWKSGMAVTSGDFDGDGDLDFIAGSCSPSSYRKAGLYFFENDGKGNFKLREPKKE